MAKQRRKGERTPVTGPVVVKTGAESRDDLPQVAWLKDFGSGGIYLVLDQKLSVGTPLDLVFTLPREIAGNPSLVRCRGHVVRVEHRDALVGVGAAIEEIKLLHEQVGP